MKSWKIGKGEGKKNTVREREELTMTSLKEPPFHSFSSILNLLSRGSNFIL